MWTRATFRLNRLTWIASKLISEYGLLECHRLFLLIDFSIIQFNSFMVMHNDPNCYYTSVLYYIIIKKLNICFWSNFPQVCKYWFGWCSFRTSECLVKSPDWIRATWGEIACMPIKCEWGNIQSVVFVIDISVYLKQFYRDQNSWYPILRWKIENETLDLMAHIMWIYCLHSLSVRININIIFSTINFECIHDDFNNDKWNTWTTDIVIVIIIKWDPTHECREFIRSKLAPT